MFHDLSQLFVQQVSTIDESSLKFADRSTVNSCATPLRQIHSAIPIWEVTKMFHQLKKPWGKIMRHFSVAHEDSVTKALADPAAAEEKHLGGATAPGPVQHGLGCYVPYRQGR